VKRSRGDKLIGNAMHICMEISLGNSLCSYLYIKLAEVLCFSSYLLCLFFYKIREQEGRTGSARGSVVGGASTVGWREVAGKGVGE
jgi:hypothetical protein